MLLCQNESCDTIHMKICSRYSSFFHASQTQFQIKRIYIRYNVSWIWPIVWQSRSQALTPLPPLGPREAEKIEPGNEVDNLVNSGWFITPVRDQKHIKVRSISNFL